MSQATCTLTPAMIVYFMFKKKKEPQEEIPFYLTF